MPCSPHTLDLQTHPYHSHSHNGWGLWTHAQNWTQPPQVDRGNTRESWHKSLSCPNLMVLLAVVLCSWVCVCVYVHVCLWLGVLCFFHLNVELMCKIPPCHTDFSVSLTPGCCFISADSHLHFQKCLGEQFFPFFRAECWFLLHHSELLKKE